MKTSVRIASINRKRLSESVYQALNRLVPEIEDLCRLGITFEGDDLRVPKIIELLKSAGLRPWEDDYREKDDDHEFVFAMHRQYDHIDLQGYELIRFRAKHNIQMIWDDEHGGKYVEKSSLMAKYKADILNKIIGTGCFVSNPMRQAMEAAGLKGADFLKFYLKEKKSLPDGSTVHATLDWSNIPNGPWWQLASKEIMPALSSRMALRDKDGNPLKPGGDYGYFAIEGFYGDPELRYPRSSLKKMPPFDIAFTREHWGGWKDDTDRDFVVSKRFMEVALAQKWKVTFSPVHIDEDL